jgi:hypothetical protein
VLIRRCVDYLRDSRGLCLRSIEAYLPFVRASVAAQQLPERMSGVDGLAVRNHVLDAWRGRSISFVRLLTAALRSFLRFCFLDATTLRISGLPSRPSGAGGTRPFPRS